MKTLLLVLVSWALSLAAYSQTHKLVCVGSPLNMGNDGFQIMNVPQGEDPYWLVTGRGDDTSDGCTVTVYKAYFQSGLEQVRYGWAGESCEASLTNLIIGIIGDPTGIGFIWLNSDPAASLSVSFWLDSYYDDFYIAYAWGQQNPGGYGNNYVSDNLKTEPWREVEIAAPYYELDYGINVYDSSLAQDGSEYTVTMYVNVTEEIYGIWDWYSTPELTWVFAVMEAQEADDFMYQFYNL